MNKLNEQDMALTEQIKKYPNVKDVVVFRKQFRDKQHEVIAYVVPKIHFRLSGYCRDRKKVWTETDLRFRKIHSHAN